MEAPALLHVIVADPMEEDEPAEAPLPDREDPPEPLEAPEDELEEEELVEVPSEEDAPAGPSGQQSRQTRVKSSAEGSWS